MPNTPVERHAIAALAERFGWAGTWSDVRDEFVRAETSIVITYTPNDDLRLAVRRGPDGAIDSVGVDSALDVDLLRFWLTGHRTEGSAPQRADQPGTYEDFWRLFRRRLEVEHPEWGAVKGTRTMGWSDVKTGSPYTTLCSCVPHNDLMRLELRFKKPKARAFNAARFRALQSVKDEFEAALGLPAVWDGPLGPNDFRIFLQSGFRWSADRSQWPAMFDWLMDAHERLMRAIHAVGGLDNL